MYPTVGLEETTLCKANSVRSGKHSLPSAMHHRYPTRICLNTSDWLVTIQYRCNVEAQLTLLEQQNQKRLLMTRQEQDIISSQLKSFQVKGQATREQGVMPYMLDPAPVATLPSLSGCPC